MDYTFHKFNKINNIRLQKQQFSGRDVESHNKNSRNIHFRKKKKLHIFSKILIFLFSIGLLGGFFSLGVVKGILANTPPLSSIHLGPTKFATNIYNRNGDLIETLVQEGSNRESVSYSDIPEQMINAFVAIEDERFWEHTGIDIKSILRAIYGVFFSETNLGGGSTITQQLIKNTVFNTENYSAFNEKGFEKYVRKLQEQYLAMQYEDTIKSPSNNIDITHSSKTNLSSPSEISKLQAKEQIITEYLNIINLGANTLGVKVATKKYFDKNLSDLKITKEDSLESRAKKISESAVLAGITKNPSKFNPITHPDENDKRRKQVLYNMREQGYISDKEYTLALEDDVYARIKNVDVRQSVSNKAYSYFTEAVIDEVLETLQKQLGYNPTLANNLLYSGGLTIKTTQDPKIQNIVDNVINDESNYTVKKYSLDYRLSILHKDGTQTHYAQQDIDKYNKDTLKNKKYDGLFASKDECDKYVDAFKTYIMKEDDSIAGETLNYILQPQCSFTIIDHTNGEVLAICGGRGEKTVSRGLNRATNTLRQPGSTFKVLTSFAPALEINSKALSDVYYDSPYIYKEKEFKNWYSNGFLGFQNIRNGIIYSLNIIAVRCIMETVSPEKGVEFAEKLGISTLVKSGTLNDINPASALGGLTKGVSNIELTTAFATIANGGKYNKAKFVTEIIDHKGNVLIDNTKVSPKKVMSEQNAFLLTDAMKQSMEGRKCYSGSITVNSTSTRASFKDMALAGKSGTTTKNNDVWFVGYSPYYTAGVWGGLDENQTLQDTGKKINNGGTNYHKNIWRKIMQEIHKDKKNPGFTRPNGLVTKTVCLKCGKLASEKCKLDKRGNCTYKEYFVDGTQPTKYCTCHDQDGYMIIPNKYANLTTDDSQFINPNLTVPIIQEIDEIEVVEPQINNNNSNIIIAPPTAIIN